MKITHTHTRAHPSQPTHGRLGLGSGSCSLGFPPDEDGAGRLLGDLVPSPVPRLMAVVALGRPATLDGGELHRYWTVGRGRKGGGEGGKCCCWHEGEGGRRRREKAFLNQRPRQPNGNPGSRLERVERGEEELSGDARRKGAEEERDGEGVRHVSPDDCSLGEKGGDEGADGLDGRASCSASDVLEPVEGQLTLVEGSESSEESRLEILPRRDAGNEAARLAAGAEPRGGVVLQSHADVGDDMEVVEGETRRGRCSDGHADLVKPVLEVGARLAIVLG